LTALLARAIGLRIAALAVQCVAGLVVGCASIVRAGAQGGTARFIQRCGMQRDYRRQQG
jgi:hypothetical protein